MSNHILLEEQMGVFYYLSNLTVFLYSNVILFYNKEEGTYQTIKPSTQKVHGSHLHRGLNRRDGGSGRSQIQVQKVT